MGYSQKVIAAKPKRPGCPPARTAAVLMLGLPTAEVYGEPLAALQRSEIRYRRLFEAARDGSLLVDPHTRKITDANPFVVDLIGYSHEELLGRKLWEFGLLKDERTVRFQVGVGPGQPILD